MIRRSPTSTCRCPTGATARCASPTPSTAGGGCSSRPTGCRRSTASSPACRTRARCSTSSPRGGSTAPPTSSPTTSSTSPTRTCSSPGRPTTLPVEVVVRGYITGVTSTSLWRPYAAGARTIYGYHFPDGLAKNTALPEPLVTPTTKPPTGSTVHDEPLTWAEVVERGLVERRRWEQVDGDRPRAVPPRPGGRRGGRADPRRHEVRVRPHRRRRAAADRRGAHAGLVAVSGSPTSYEERLAAGEEPESLDKEVVRRALADAGFTGDGDVPELPADVWTATSAALHRRLPATDRAAVRARRHPDRAESRSLRRRRARRSVHDASAKSAACSASRRRTARASPS